MFGLEIKFNESSEAENSNTIARKFIMAMYGKTIAEFVRDLERTASTTDAEPVQSSV